MDTHSAQRLPTEGPGSLWTPWTPARPSCQYRGLTGQFHGNPPPPIGGPGAFADNFGTTTEIRESPAFILCFPHLHGRSYSFVPSPSPSTSLCSSNTINNHHNASSTIRRPRSLAPYRLGAPSQASAGSSCRHHGRSSSSRRRRSSSSPGRRSRLPGSGSLWPDGQHRCVSQIQACPGPGPKPPGASRSLFPMRSNDIYAYHGPLF